MTELQLAHADGEQDNGQAEPIPLRQNVMQKLQPSLPGSPGRRSYGDPSRRSRPGRPLASRWDIEMRKDVSRHDLTAN